MSDISAMLYYNTSFQLTNAVATDNLGPFAGYKTATYTLTDTLLGELTNNVILNTGIRAFNANQSFGGFRATNVGTPVGNGDAANKQYVDNAVAGIGTFLPAVLSATIYAQPVTPLTGDRYLLGLSSAQVVTGTDWTGNGGKIAEWSGTAWTFDTPGQSDFVLAQDTNVQYIFQTGAPDPFVNGTWVIFSTGALQAGDGIDIVAQVISVDILALGGLKFVGGELTVSPTDIIDNSTLFVNGSGDIAIQFAVGGTSVAKANSAQDLISFGANQGAKILGFDPTSVPQTTSTTVQGAIQDSFTFAAQVAAGFTMIAGVNINKGYCCYADNSDIANIYPIQSPLGLYPIGLAQSTVTTGSQLKISKSNVKLSGVLTGAIAGQQLFWNNLTQSHVTSAPATSGYAIVQTGYAANSQDLIVDVALLRING
jgi:hypothetical protein